MAGGKTDATGDATNSAELYNPTMETFTVTGNLNVERYWHTATLVNNGMVLVAGGFDFQQSNILGDAELYNPATGTFTTTGTLTTARYNHTATLLNNGTVLMAGGYNSADSLTNSAELYAPIAGTFTPTGSLTTALYLDTATLLDNGMVLMAGGYGSNGVLGSGELYQPATLTPSNLVSISLAPGSPTVPLGSALTFTATGTFSGGDTEQLASVTWSSSSPGVVSISEDASNAGAAYAVATGSATVSACAGSVCGSTTVTVNQGVVSITVTPSNATIIPGATQQFSAMATYDNGVTQDVSSSAYWDTSNASAATVAAGGLATGVAGGSTTITASLGSLQGSATLNVANVTVLTRNLPQGVAMATATDLPELDGVVAIIFIAGGFDSNGPTNRVQGVNSNGTTGSEGNLNTARYAHTATFLNTGEILFTGGMGPNGPLNSAELFEPGTRKYVYTGGTLETARYGHTATLLQNGMVLIAGGFDSNGNPLSSAELYDPTTKAFKSAGNLNAARGWHTATLLNNGWVLFTGGSNSLGPISGAEIYFPESGYFKAIGPLNAARAYHTATLLNNGTVLIAGGMGSNGAPLASAEIFNPGIEAFFATGNLNNARFSHSATFLGNGTVLMSGGVGANGLLASQEVYDPNLAGFAFTSSLNVARAGHTATVINFSIVLPNYPNGKVVIAGGYDGNGLLASTEFYTPDTFAPPDLVSISITPAPYLSSPADLATGEAEKLIAVGTFSDGSSAQLGGVTWTEFPPGPVRCLSDATNPGLCVNLYGDNGSATITAALGTVSGTTTVTSHDFVTTTTGSLITPRWQHAATLLNNGQVLITGGMDSNGNTSDSAELYDPASGTFGVTGSLNTARKLHTATLLKNGMVLIAGGTDSSNNTLTSAELYDPATGTFTPTGNMVTSLATHTATLLTNGTVLFVGGFNGNIGIGGGTWGVSGSSPSTSQLYNPATGTFSVTGGLNTPRWFHTANLLNDGTVLIAGGVGNGIVILNTAELYNPSLGTFTALTNNLLNARFAHTATLMVGGTVLLAGGQGASNTIVNTGEIYDPTSQTFTAARDNMPYPGYWQTGTLSNSSGGAFIPGGFNGSPLSTTERYYTEGTILPLFQPVPAMANARYLHTATLLPNGMVLIVGGAGASDVPVGPAELY
ncbi:MAG: kelch repeat-containing protein, partial [Terriglobia bacterium]|jgi:hypothetical protein